MEFIFDTGSSVITYLNHLVVLGANQQVHNLWLRFTLQSWWFKSLQTTKLNSNNDRIWNWYSLWSLILRLSLHLSILRLNLLRRFFNVRCLWNAETGSSLIRWNTRIGSFKPKNASQTLYWRTLWQWHYQLKSV